MKTIELTQGLFAQVDDADYPLLNQYYWYAVKSSNGHTHYAQTNLGDHLQMEMHKFLLNPDHTPGLVVDHIDLNGLNNQRANLRLATHQQNMYNRPPLALPNQSSKYKGVYFDKGSKRYRAQIRINGKPTKLGSFLSETDAARAYDHAARQAHGSFAYLNFPDPPP